MKKTVSLFLFLHIFLLLKCKKKEDLETNDHKIIEVENKFSKAPILFSEVIDSISFIKLETTSKCIIGEIKKVIPYKNKVYIHDSKTKSILCFNPKGEFLKKIKAIGKGPGEYLKISEFFISNDKIHIYDAMLRKILLYSTEGEFIEAIKTGRDLIRYIIPLDDGGYLCSNELDSGENTRVGFWKINNKGKTQEPNKQPKPVQKQRKRNHDDSL